MDFQFKLITENLASPIEVWIFVIPIFIHGVVHWIKLTDKKPYEAKTLIIMVPSMLCFLYFILQGKWHLSLIMLGTNKIGKITVAPILDLFWSYRHFGDPFKCFFLSKNRRLGPSQKAINTAESKIYGLNLRYSIPERNINPESGKSCYGEINRKLTKQLEIFENIVEVKRWQRYEWSTQSKRYLVASDPMRDSTRFYMVGVTLCEARFDDKKCGPYEAMLEVIVGQVFDCGSHQIFEDARFHIDSIEVRQRVLGKQNAVFVSVKSDLIYDNFTHFILVKSGRNKLVFFEVADDNQHSWIIAELIFSTLDIKATKQANHLSVRNAENHEILRDANLLMDRFTEQLILKRNEEARSEQVEIERYEKKLEETKKIQGAELY